MAEKTLRSDMTELVSATRKTQEHASTLLVEDFRRDMLKAAHMLALNSKHLLDAIDRGRAAGMTQN